MYSFRRDTWNGQAAEVDDLRSHAAWCDRQGYADSAIKARADADAIADRIGYRD